MSDLVVVVPEEGPVWFAKNSDREPNEAQFLEYREPGAHLDGMPDDLPETHHHVGVLMSRAPGMWGCEMGVNEHGVAIGNAPVMTRFRVPGTGHAGMDLQRIALARSRTADDALEHLIELTETFRQGGRMGYRHGFTRYNSAFLIADSNTAWIFETAGDFWAAKRVRGVAAISNALSIEDDFDQIDETAYSFAEHSGWLHAKEDFNFARVFSTQRTIRLDDSKRRRLRVARQFSGVRAPDVPDFIRALTAHGDSTPGRARRHDSPCAHASWRPTMASAQTTASLIARLDQNGPTVWATGTSSPCLSVFKPAPFDSKLFSPRPILDARFDDRELWWAHERLHRACILDYSRRRATFAEDRESFQEVCLELHVDAERAWRDHRAHVDDWLQRASQLEADRMPSLNRWYWSRQSKVGGFPGK